MAVTPGVCGQRMYPLQMRSLGNTTAQGVLLALSRWSAISTAGRMIRVAKPPRELVVACPKPVTLRTATSPLNTAGRRIITIGCLAWPTIWLGAKLP
jgi:hypothetical protein